ncbi:MAG TPA: hypothetical protein VFC92_02135 [Bacteroidales bacterium]|jgi:hypothetical protein|nr:hypothetical protein [Bacteroidales bacterium]
MKEFPKEFPFVMAASYKLHPVLTGEYNLDKAAEIQSVLTSFGKAFGIRLRASNGHFWNEEHGANQSVVSVTLFRLTDQPRTVYMLQKMCESALQLVASLHGADLEFRAYNLAEYRLHYPLQKLFDES